MLTFKKSEKLLLDRIKSKIKKAKVISFDIFDTLLVRPYVRPIDLFEHMERALECPGFANERRDAERRARIRHRELEDITFDMIYDEIDEEYKHLKQKEMDWEEMVLRPNPELKQVYDYAKKLGKKIIIVSDMYMPSKFLRRVLRKNGFKDFDGLYVSGEIGKTKSKGSVYQYILAEFDIEPHYFLHCGDNIHSDYNKPISFGMQAVCVKNNVEYLFQKNEKTQIFYNKNKTLAVSIFIALIANSYKERRKNNYWENIGYEYGGLVSYAYSLWMVKQMRNEGISEAMFVARDGYTLQRVFSELFSQEIKSHYVCAPRFVFYSTNPEAAIESYSEDALLKYYKQIAKENNIDLPKDNKLSAKDYISQYSEIIQELAKKEKESYQKYLQTLNMKNDKLAMVDTVTGGLSSLRLLQNNLPDKNILGLFWIILGNARKFCDDYNMRAWNPSISNGHIKCWDFVEYLLTSPEPPILRIKDNKIQYRDNLTKQEKAREKLYPIISDNAVNFCKEIHKLNINNSIVFSEKEIVSWLNILFETPNKEDREKLKNIDICWDSSHTKSRPLYDFNNMVSTTKYSLLNCPIFKKEKSKKYHDTDITKFKFFDFTLFTFRQKPDRMYLRSLCFPIFTRKINGNEITYKLFGITILTKNKQNLNRVINDNTNQIMQLRREVNKLKEDLYYSNLELKMNSNNEVIDEKTDKQNAFCSAMVANMEYVFPNIELTSYNQDIVNAKYCFLWGSLYNPNTSNALNKAIQLNLPVYIWENGFIRSACGWEKEIEYGKYTKAVSFIVDKVPYFDATKETNLEKMLNDEALIIGEKEIARAKKCINKLIENHLTKYNHQPIFTPQVGRVGVKKVLVVDQSYRDMSITKGLADDLTFKNMLQKAIEENPEADILVKVHPDTLAGQRGGYYSSMVTNESENIYILKDKINPISLINYVDKVYVCSSQFGFEALMCGKEVHTFGMPFYAGWGLTTDYLKCNRRTNKRTLEEIFYITYIMYTKYVNPNKKSLCEIEEAIDYLIDIRDEFFKRYDIRNDFKKSKKDIKKVGV